MIKVCLIRARRKKNQVFHAFVAREREEQIDVFAMAMRRENCLHHRGLQKNRSLDPFFEIAEDLLIHIRKDTACQISIETRNEFRARDQEPKT